MGACVSCAAECAPQFRFCPRCGAELPRAEAAPAVRKTVTILFTDLVDSTSIGERLEPETVRWVMDRYFETAKATIERYGGVVEKFIGDAVMAVFGVPATHEDDAVRTVRAALEMRNQLRALNADLERHAGVMLEARTGISTGEVIAATPEGGDRIVTGDTVNVAARLEEAAPPGGIVIGELTYRLVRDVVQAEPLPPLRLKGKTATASAWLLHGLVPGDEPFRRRFETPLVGRAPEMGTLRSAFERAIDKRAVQLVNVLGAPGVGKTRLVQEFVEMIGDGATILHGHARAYGERVTFRPLAEMIRPLVAGGVDLEDILGPIPNAREAASVLAAVTDPDGPSGPFEEIPWAVRNLFEAIGRRRPLVLVVDDVHWAEPPLLDLLEHITVRSRDAAILLICIARTELLDERPDWGGALAGGETIVLEPLDPDETELVASNLLGGLPFPAAVRDRVVKTCEGNPLFVEQLLGSLLDERRIHLDGATWVGPDDLEDVPTPATVTALLEARLERLPADERATLERASIEGQRFHEEALRSLTPEGSQAAVDHDLQALIRRRLIRTDEATLAGLDGFRFVHVLVHETAYKRLPKETRADLHERYARWLTQESAARSVSLDETVAWHLERAYHLRLDLGPEDDEARRLGLEAGDLLGAACQRHFDAGDPRAAYELAMRAAELPARSPVVLGNRVLDAAWAAIYVPGHERFRLVFPMLDRADAIVEEIGDPSLTLRARALRHCIRSIRGDVVDDETTAVWLHDQLERPCLDVDARFEALATLSQIYVTACDGERLLEVAEQMEHEAEKSGRPGLVKRAFWFRMTASRLFSNHLSRDLAWIRRRAQRFIGNVFVEGQVAFTEASLLAMMGEHEEAASAHDRFLAIDRDLAFENTPLNPSAAGLLEATMAYARGDLDEAVERWRDYVSVLDANDMGGFASTDRLELARCLLERGHAGDIDAAEASIAEAEAQTQPGDRMDELLVPYCRTLLAVRRGDPPGAMAQARAALDAVGPHVWPCMRALALLGSALALRSAGRIEEAAANETAAFEIYDQVGAAAFAHRARAVLSIAVACAL